MIRSGALLLVLMLVLPLQAEAARTVGMIMPRDCSFGEEVKDKFTSFLVQQGLKAQDLEVYLQRPGSDKVSRLNSMRKFLAIGADVLVVWGGTALKEVALEAGKTPIVFIGAYDPVKDGLVADLQSPGKNVTGVLGKTSMVFLVDNIIETASPSSLGVIYHSDVTDSISQLDDLKSLAPGKGIKIVSVDAIGKETDAVASALASTPFIYLAQGCAVENNMFPALAVINKPAATQNPGVTGGGIVFNLAPNGEEMIREAAGITARILKGEKPSAIPVARPKKIDFTINLAEARRFDLKIPFSVLNRGTEVIK